MIVSKHGKVKSSGMGSHVQLKYLLWGVWSMEQSRLKCTTVRLRGVFFFLSP